MTIDWGAFGVVLIAALIVTAIVVSLYSLGLRLLTVSGRTPIVAPAEFTDAIAIITPAELEKAEKRAAKAARKSPLTEREKRFAYLGAYGCFGLSALAVLIGIWLIVGENVMHHLGL
ncbi:peptidase [Agromyces seonyuensis]|uniref:Peptidase n=1 Tax=Agromyces seonyuensis TaxID=2662446 RepID=A0A6I4NUQ5_9MICO|nr:peptidase [Agromyces seonyuensis]MWB98030.1 peptidase [Agromyces seonyuensis]